MINIKVNNQLNNFSNIKDFYKYIIKEDDIKNKKIIIKNANNNDYEYLLNFILFYKRTLNILKSGQQEINNNLKKEVINKNIESIIDDFIDLNQDGKYIRGTLIALGYYLASNKSDLEYLNLAYAYEMFQTSVLIHDDIIDNADLRRGKETIPKRIHQKYLNDSNNKDYQNDVLSLSNSIGICAGDLGFYEANQIIIKNYSNNKNLVKILEFYNDIIIKTIKGEMLDVMLPFKGKYNLVNIEEKDVFDIYHLKTSWYTIIGPFFLGYILGGKDKDKNIENILNKIGISFQIKDDILGIFSNTSSIGKSNVSDIEEFKQTIFYSHIIATPYKDEFLKLYGKQNISEEELNKIRELLELSGSYKYALDYLDKIYKEIITDLDKINLSDEGKNILKGLLIYINIREK